MKAISFETLKEELKKEIVPAKIAEWSSLNAREQGFYELFETDEETLYLKRTLLTRYPDGMIPYEIAEKEKERYSILISHSMNKRITKLL